ncbi:TraB/GumN family protein [Ferrimonas lipolytica]|uniref:TraB/GumN family protein n=1 Tax=Ferrimonas lipolytica TaxID=2724191 RepID=A0A6H1UHR9_9GAMM|nr:TraB/GumN family protein [Ferrimonas lipolytica]QIZ78631.1 TraB/GumN family protein [Ferrimonas lipolytica]
MKYLLLAIWFVIGSGLPLAAAETDKPLFYQLQLGEQQAWLLGSIHVGTADFYPLPMQIEAAIEQASALVLEANPNDPNLPALFAQYALAKKPLPHALASKIRQHCQQQQLQCNLDLAPWLLSSQMALAMMTQAGYSPALGVESQLLLRFKPQQVLELEGMAMQLKLFDSLSYDANIAMAEASIDEFDVGQMVDAWRHGDSDALQQLIFDDFTEDELMQVLMFDRNRYMVNKIERMMSAQNQLLIVVGAGHLVGQQSMVQLLRQQGVTVTNCWQRQCQLRQ